MSLATGLSTSQPVCFYRCRNGDIFFVNGVDRVRRWDGVTAAAELAGITAPVSVPTVTAASSGGATAGDYVFAVQYIDDTTPDPVQSSISALVTVTLADNQKASWSSIPVSPEARVVQKRLWMSTSGETETLYLVTTISNATTTYSGFTGSDDTLSDNTSLAVLQPNGDLNARRFGVPPSYHPYACVFQDRVFMAGNLTLTPATRNKIHFSEDDEPESMPDTNEVTVQDNTGDEDEVTGLMPYGAFLYVLKERHIYSLKFVRQPKIDVGINCIAWRGCLNNRCWTILDGMAYVMDQTGIYQFAGGQPEPIDAPIQNQFWDGTIDFTNAKWFTVCADTARKLVYFFVSYTADSSTRPKRALVFDALKQAWLPDKYVWEIGGAAIVPIAGKARLLVGTDNRILATGQGTSDLVTAVRGTATSATSNTLTDSTASFGTLTDAPIAIAAGTGVGQIRRISSNSSTAITVSSNWTTTPDATSVYVVGGIQWSHKTGLLEFPPSEKRYERKLELSFTPTTHTNVISVKQFKNKYATATTQQVSEDRGTGVTATRGLTPIIFDITQAREAHDDASGMSKVGLEGITDDNSNAQRWLSLEFSGVQGQDQIVIDGYEITGVER